MSNVVDMLLSEKEARELSVKEEENKIKGYEKQILECRDRIKLHQNVLKEIENAVKRLI